MAILDSLPKDESDVQRALEQVARAVENMQQNTAAGSEKVFELMSKGFSLGDILDLSGEKLDAVFVKAFHLLRAGEWRKARQLFWTLCQLQPLEERFTYGLATTYQIEGDFDAAGRLYVLYLALNASCIEGRLRLGECFLGAGEIDNALSMFRSAARECADTGAPEQIRNYSEAMVARCEGMKKLSVQ